MDVDQIRKFPLWTGAEVLTIVGRLVTGGQNMAKGTFQWDNI